MRNNYPIIVGVILSLLTINTAFSQAKPKALIIPYEYKMYFSEVDEELHQENDMSFAEINAKFRSALDQNIFVSLNKTYDPISFYAFDNKEEARKELSYIHSSIGYKYEVLKVEKEEKAEEKSPVKKLWNKIQQPKEDKIENQPKESVTQGQVTTSRDTREKYMMTKITNDNLIPTLNKSYGAHYYIFINQLDIKKALGSEYYSIADDSYKREIKVHYTIISKSGDVVSSSAKKAYFSANMNDINKIVKTHIAEIAQHIAGEIQSTSESGQEEKPVVLH